MASRMGLFCDRFVQICSYWTQESNNKQQTTNDKQQESSREEMNSVAARARYGGAGPADPSPRDPRGMSGEVAAESGSASVGAEEPEVAVHSALPVAVPEHAGGFVARDPSRARTSSLHYHDELELNLVLRGRASYRVRSAPPVDPEQAAPRGARSRSSRRARRERTIKPESKLCEVKSSHIDTIEVRRRSLIWFAPGVEHQLVEPSEDFSMWALACRPDLVRLACFESSITLLAGTGRSLPHWRPLPESDALSLSGQFEQLRNADSLQTFNAGLAYAVTRSWDLHRRAAHIPESREIHGAVEQAAALLRTSSQRLGRAELAARCGLSESQLSRLFKQQMGVSLTEFRNRSRVQRFRELFGNGHRYTLVEAALEAGFGSYPQFHRVFKQIQGCGPAEYSRRAREGTLAAEPAAARGGVGRGVSARR